MERANRAHDDRDEVARAAWELFEDQDDAYSAAFRHATTHILATELTESAIRASLAAGHAYVAHDWLCDPSGVAFFAQSYFGLFEMGDTVVHNPVTGAVTIAARLPVPASIRLLRDNMVVAEAKDWKLDYVVRDPGAYRIEALLTIDGEERPWIFTNPITVGPPSNVALPAAQTPPGVQERLDISYTEGDPADAAKHKLDLYLPQGKTNFPVLLFVHGGSWRTGDRAIYKALGERFARAGIGVAIPSYRLMPQNPHPAQIEDVAAAFAWVYRNAAQLGGDASRIYASGHSAGAHLVSLLALDEKYLKKFDLDRKSIAGVIAMSGVYNVGNLETFVQAIQATNVTPPPSRTPVPGRRLSGSATASGIISICLSRPETLTLRSRRTSFPPSFSTSLPRVTFPKFSAWFRNIANSWT